MIDLMFHDLRSGVLRVLREEAVKMPRVIKIRLSRYKLGLLKALAELALISVLSANIASIVGILFNLSKVEVPLVALAFFICFLALPKLIVFDIQVNEVPTGRCVKCGALIYGRNMPFVCPHCSAEGTLYPLEKELRTK